MKTTAVTAAMLYDFVRCPHRVTMDLVGNPADRDPVSPFARLLWEPDLLRRAGQGYAADIKSSAGFEGADDESDGWPKKHYAVQMGLYTDIRSRSGYPPERLPFS